MRAGSGVLNKGPLGKARFRYANRLREAQHPDFGEGWRKGGP